MTELSNHLGIMETCGTNFRKDGLDRSSGDKNSDDFKTLYPYGSSSR